MSCCGNKRGAIPGIAFSNPSSGQTQQLVQPQARPPVAAVIFEYLGATGLTAIGPVTRKLYRFERPHARVAVDARDATSISAIPNLRQIR